MITWLERPREFLKDFSKEERQKLRDAAFEEIHEYVLNNASDAAALIMEKCCDDVESMLNWTYVSDADDETVETILGFWPWKDDPIPASELGIKESDDD